MSELPALTGYSFWLLLSQKSEEHVSGWMSRFRQAYPSPVFQPHLTLLGLDSKVIRDSVQEENLIHATKTVSSETSPFQLEMNGIDGNEHPYQPFYIQIKATQNLHSLRKKLITRLNIQLKSDTYNPHISLLYGKMDKKERQSLIRDIPAHPTGHLFAAGIGLIRVNGTPENWEMILRSDFN